MRMAGGDVDRISALPDDLLHLILGFVRDAKSLTRTAVLSRRWRRVWIYAQQLSLLGTTRVRRGADPSQFVDWVLAQRGDADIESLHINMSRLSSLEHTSQEKVKGWLRYAMPRVLKSFHLDLPWPWATTTYTSPSDRRVDGPAVVLPDRGRMTSICMYLTSRYSFQLPVAASAKYEALTELKLTGVSFSGEECSAAGRTLGDFVSSSCCPRLRKLDILILKGLAQLVIRSEALETFKLRSAQDLRVLDVTAPNLGVLELEHCFEDWSDGGGEDVTVKKARIASSRLQEIGMSHHPFFRRPDLEIHDLTSVCRLSGLRLDMHGQYYVGTTDVGFWLLERCPSVEHVSVRLGHHPSQGSVIEGDIVVDLTVEGAAPFASVRIMDMTVDGRQFQDCQLVPSIFALLLRCPRLTSLSIRIFDDTTSGRMCSFCDEQYAGADHRAISLKSLEDVKLIGFGGADEDMELVRLLFSSAMNSIKSMTLEEITKTSGTVSLKRMMAEDDGNSTETIDQKLMNIPSVDRGRWRFGDTIYTWTCYATENTTPRPVHGDDANTANSA